MMMTSQESGTIKVFISYSHDSLDHKNRVLNLSNCLCDEGIDCNIDQYERSPAEGWPRWMNNQIETADYVLVICTENYKNRFKGRGEPRKGLGVKWEGAILTQELYEDEAKNKKFIPVVFSSDDVNNIPVVLKGATYYTLDDDQGYDNLYARLTDQRLIHKPKIGKIRELPPTEGRDVQKPITKAKSLDKIETSTSSQYIDYKFDIPYRQNSFFTGREEILEQLHYELKSNNAAALSQPMAICGLGGIGKTQVAIEYIYRYRDEYEPILWVKADSRDSIVSDYVSIAKYLHLPVKDDSDQNLVVTAVRNWLRTNDKWLLVLDNADDPRLIEYFLPSNLQGYILLTSRAPSFDNLGITNPIEIKKMLTEEAKEFFFKRTGRRDLDQAEVCSLQELITELDCLPLAMEQAGAYIHKLNCSFTEYLYSYRRHGLELLKKSKVQSTQYPKSVSTTWLLNFEQVEQTSKISADILFASAFLNCNNIPFDIFIKGSEELGENIHSLLHGIEDDALIFKEALKPLRQFSLITTYYDKTTFDIHRLVQVVLKDRIEKNEQKLWAERTYKALNCVFPDAEYKNWELCDKLLPHAQACAEYIKQWNFETEESAKLLSKAGIYLHERARFKESESLLKSSLEIRKKVLEPDHFDISESLNKLGNLYRDLGKYSEAETLYVRALEIRENTLKPEDSAIAESLNYLGELYCDFGRYSEAESLNVRALEIRENTSKPEDPAIAESLDHLARIYVHLGRFSEAESLRIRALDISEKAYGSEHPEVGACLNNLAGVYSKLGRYSEAQTLLIRSLNISEKALGPEHPAVGVNLNNLAKVYNDLGRYSEAETLCIRALKITEDALGPEHPDMGNRLETLADSYRNSGKYSEAETLYMRALEISEKALGPEHPYVGIVFNNVAVFFHDRKSYFKSKKYYERAIKITEKAIGENSLEVASILERYASSLEKMNRNRDATTKRNRAKMIRSKIEKGSKKLI